MTGTRQSVLTIYRTILRTAQKWEAASGKVQDTREEREYIQQETRTLFKKNMQLSDPSEIENCLKEAESRFELVNCTQTHQSFHNLLMKDPLRSPNETSAPHYMHGMAHAAALSTIPGSSHTLHYKSPYPRAVNIPPMGLPPTKSRGKKAQDRLRKQAKPIYLHSQDDT